ncbi:ABC transporter ATP-binding protein [Nitrosovibrio tenuis]|uniref:ABC-2 type transport system ATP-binding protein n=1 Tax=Nitrosovibrio tenuis TaxID=1233 RepID=A0A1H7GQJ1_9PROT|nr:ABC transporter ATP-binding protein [Nitrosovibrio tenuis]SEK38145.1 ABC-2 type transport system ATP-binding protein [Nitrosovibrio tenuis]
MTEQIVSPTLSVKGLCRYFGTRAAAHDVNLELRRGEVLGLLGPNGAGKTTIMRMLTGNLAPSAGVIKICGVDLLDKPREAKSHIGYLPEIPPLYRQLTVGEYLRLAARLHHVAKAKIEAALDEVVQRCGLGNTRERLIGLLSKGYQQRVGIAQALIHGPDVIILDEPTVGLDPNQMRDIRSLIRELGAKHSVILSTHILSEVEAVCDRVHILHGGRTVFSDSVNELKQKGASLEEIFMRYTMNIECPGTSLTP